MHLALDDIKEYTHDPRMCPFEQQELESRRTDTERRVVHLRSDAFAEDVYQPFQRNERYVHCDESIFDEREGDWMTHRRHRMVKRLHPWTMVGSSAARACESTMRSRLYLNTELAETKNVAQTAQEQRA
ncbi:hypothetical protein BGX34_000522 [Mortierella sp. NVP85]|nr:hypothetical protein BGX34_000522 [Mortierella sp. NVP85]